MSKIRRLTKGIMFYRVKVAPNSKHASSRSEIRSTLHIVALKKPPCWKQLNFHATPSWFMFDIAGLAVGKKCCWMTIKVLLVKVIKRPSGTPVSYTGVHRC